MEQKPVTWTTAEMPQHGMYSTCIYLLMCVVLILKTQVSEINLYITEVESDVRGAALVILLIISSFFIRSIRQHKAVLLNVWN